LSAELPQNDQPSDPINEETLEAEMTALKQASELGKGKKFLLFLFLVLVIAGLTWAILSYFVFIPQQQARAKAEKQRMEQAQAEEAARLQQLEQQRLAQIAKEKALKLKEENRLRRIQQNTIAGQVAIKDKQWQLAEKYISQLQADKHKPEEITKLQARIDQGREDQRKLRAKISTLIKQAETLDTGVYSAEAISHLDEVLTLAPKHPKATALRKKIDNYQTEFRVPEDYPTIAEVLPKARAGDTILLAEGNYNFSVILTKPLIIKGAGIGKTIVKCDTTKQSAFAFIHDENSEKEYSLSGLTIHGTTYQDFNIDRYPLVLVKSKVTIDKADIGMSSGHGIAVLSGELNLSNSVITYNGWDGVSVRGIGAKANISKCKIHTNYDHGIDFWQDASGSILDCEVHENTGSGIVVMGRQATVKITQTRSYKNEQCGIVAMDRGSIELARVVTASNVLSGIAVQGNQSKAKFGMVISNNNKEAGYYLDPASQVSGYENTTSEGNLKGNVVRKALQFSIQRQSD